MKYFTMEWWMGACREPVDTIDSYRRYLDGIIADLPDALRQLATEVSLHDGRLRHLYLSIPEKCAVLGIDGQQWEPEANAYFDRRYRLTYSGVESLASSANPEIGMMGPHGYGDLGYDEIELLRSGIYEHRMLFSSGIELQIRFSHFSLSQD